MNIILVDCYFGDTDGHHIELVSSGEARGVISLTQILAEKGYDREPDLIVQGELLGERVFIEDLASFSCPKFFWAIDVHLNMFWHRYYARLFDVIITPHKSLFDALPPRWATKNAKMFTVPGRIRKWKAYSSRKHFASFVGVMDEERILRMALATMLRDRYGVSMTSMSFAEMLDLYDDTQVIPNESICNEINFRLFEGASCGCCVLMPDIGNDLADNFEPDKECLIYKNVLELDDLLSFLKKRQNISEAIGKNAQRRILECHLPKHRFSTILQSAKTISASSRSAETCRRNLLLARIELARSDERKNVFIPKLIDGLLQCEPHPDVQEMLLRLQLEFGQDQEKTCSMAEQLLASSQHRAECGNDIDINLLVAVAAFKINNQKLFNEAWRKQFGEAQEPCNNDMRVAFLGWAKFLASHGRLCQPGFLFDPQKHCPQTAIELLLMAEPPMSENDNWHNWIKCLTSIAERSPLKGHYQYYCTRLANAAPDNWENILRLGLSELHAYKLDGGILTMEKAIDLANRAGALSQIISQLENNGIALEQLYESMQRKMDKLVNEN